MAVLRSILLFALAALAEIGGAWLVWRGLAFVGAGVLALGLYGFVATFRLTRTSAGSWPPTAASGPTATTWLGAALCLAGVAVIMYAPRTS